MSASPKLVQTSQRTSGVVCWQPRIFRFLQHWVMIRLCFTFLLSFFRLICHCILCLLHWFTQWLVAWWHQAIIWTKVDLTSLSSHAIQLRTAPPEMLKVASPEMHELKAERHTLQWIFHSEFNNFHILSEVQNIGYKISPFSQSRHLIWFCMLLTGNVWTAVWKKKEEKRP